jgi:hypothetical protein
MVKKKYSLSDSGGQAVSGGVDAFLLDVALEHPLWTRDHEARMLLHTHAAQD